MLCFNAGWYTEDILFTVKMAMSFKDCYKNILYTPFNWNNWVGPTAKWIDYCDNSNDEDITLYQYNPVTTTMTDYWLGTGTRDAWGCMPGALWMDSVPGQILHAAVTNLLAYTTH